MPDPAALKLPDPPLWTPIPGSTEIAVTCALLVGGSLGAGWVLGVGIRRWLGRRVGGPVPAIVIPGLLLAAALALNTALALVGMWDAAMVAVLLSFGLLAALHRTDADFRAITLAVAAMALAVVLLEGGARSFLPPPPAFPSNDGPHLFLADATRAAARSGMSAVLNQEITCRLIHSPTLQGPSVLGEPSTHDYVPRPGVRARILHLGDSVVAGSVSDGRFTDTLNALEPDVEHINASICATAPDAHLALARRWVAEQSIDAVVVHLNPNDTLEIDQPYPCAGWRSLLVYDGGEPRLRNPTGSVVDPPSQFRLLLGSSPPPYVLRAAVRISAAAAHLAATSVRVGRRIGYPMSIDYDTGAAHVRMVLRAMRDELRARRIALIAVVLHFRPDAEAGVHQTNLLAIPESLGIVTLDSWERVTREIAAGAQLYTNASGPRDSHFNARGHAIMAQWLHEVLPDAIEGADDNPSPNEPHTPRS